MNIKIPKQISSNYNNINELTIEFVGTRNFKIPLNCEQIAVPDKVYNNCSKIAFHISYRTSEKTISEFSKHEVLFAKDLERLFPTKFNELIQSQLQKEAAIKIFKFEDYLRVNKKALIADKDVAWQLMKQSAVNNQQSTNVIGSKKLIYYTVYGDSYIELFQKSLQSVLETSDEYFDILIICDQITQNKIKNLEVVKSNESKILYHLVATPVDGIAASMNKTKIFDYKDINNYSHILFLDCDIIALKDVNALFNQLTDAEKFYCICNPSVNSGGYLGVYHGLDYNKEEIFEIAVKQRQKPFNAGQFAFLNSARMQQHFANINSFISNWSGPYFFEQVFMNIYFLYANCCDNVLSNYVSLANASVKNLETKHSPNDVLIHFIAPALSGEVKLEYLTKYFNAHKQ